MAEKKRRLYEGFENASMVGALLGAETQLFQARFAVGPRHGVIFASSPMRTGLSTVTKSVWAERLIETVMIGVWLIEHTSCGRSQGIAKGTVVFQRPFASHGTDTALQALGIDENPHLSPRGFRTAGAIVLGEPRVEIVGPADIGAYQPGTVCHNDIDEEALSHALRPVTAIIRSLVKPSTR